MAVEVVVASLVQTVLVAPVVAPVERERLVRLEHLKLVVYQHLRLLLMVFQARVAVVLTVVTDYQLNMVVLVGVEQWLKPLEKLGLVLYLVVLAVVLVVQLIQQLLEQTRPEELVVDMVYI
jgi:hypothetical protein